MTHPRKPSQQMAEPGFKPRQGGGMLLTVVCSSTSEGLQIGSESGVPWRGR